MAKVIRKCWVYKRRGENYRTLPRREDISQNKPYDYEKNLGTPDYFPEKLDGAPPKLWLAWIYKPHFRDERRWVKDDVKYLFGDDYKAGKMRIFPNTAAWNDRLWKIKHLIELRPLTFPKGEPTMDDVRYTEIRPDGRCIVDKRLNIDDACMKLLDEKKQMTASQLVGHSKRQWNQFKDVREDTIYTPDNVSVSG